MLSSLNLSGIRGLLKSKTGFFIAPRYTDCDLAF